MIKIAICDDELSSINDIKELVDCYRLECKQELMYTIFQSPIDLLMEIEKGLAVDVIFLDIIMPGGNGIEVAKEIREHDSSVKIIFLTSSVEYAIQSYAVNAFYYLLKPLQKEKLFQLMDSVILECQRNKQNCLVLKCKNGITRINLGELKYCEVIGRTILIYMEGGQIFECIGSLEKLYGQLTQYNNFLRPHRSYLVNMEYIQNISSKAITMNDLTEIPIPHGKYTEMKECYLEYMFNREKVFLS